MNESEQEANQQSAESEEPRIVLLETQADRLRRDQEERLHKDDEYKQRQLELAEQQTILQQRQTDLEERQTTLQERQEKLLNKQVWMLLGSIVLSALAIVVAALQGLESRRTTDLASRQVELTRQQLVATLGAEIALTDPTLRADGQISTTVMNFGKGIGTVSGSIEVLRRSAEGTEEILEPFELKLTQVAVYDDQRPHVHRISIPRVKLSQSEWELMRQQLQDTQFMSLLVRGTYQYDNGFGGKFNETFCYAFLGHPSIKLSDGTVHGHRSQFVRCNDWKMARELSTQQYIAAMKRQRQGPE